MTKERLGKNIVPIKEACIAHPDQYAPVQITEFDSKGVPLKGKVVGNWTSYEEAYKELGKVLAKSRRRKNTHFQVFSGEYFGVTTGANFRKAIEEAGRTGAIGALRRW